MSVNINCQEYNINEKVIIYLGLNELTEIPKEIQYLTQLTALCLYDNKIREIPKEIQYLIQLTELQLSHNKIREIIICQL